MQALGRGDDRLRIPNGINCLVVCRVVTNALGVLQLVAAPPKRRERPEPKPELCADGPLYGTVCLLYTSRCV